MRKELVVCLLVGISICMVASAEAQIFRRWGAPPVQQPCPQQAQQQQFQQQQQRAFAPRQVEAELQRSQVQRYQAPENRNLILVEVDRQGRVLRQLSDSQQLSRMSESRRLADGRIAELLRQPQPARVAGTSAPVVTSSQNQMRVVLPGTQRQPVVVNRPMPQPPRQLSQPVVAGYIVPQVARPNITTPSYNTGIGSQVDIARQAVTVLPALSGPTGPVVSKMEPSVGSQTIQPVITQPATVETVSLIEPATETPPGSLENATLIDANLTPESSVVPAAASEEVPGSISVLEASDDGVSILEAQDDPGSGALLLDGPEDN